MAGQSLWCLTRGEARKLAGWRVSWLLPPAALGLGALAATAAHDQAAVLGLASFQTATDIYRAFAAATLGALLLGVTAWLVATEYQEGTIRIVLARGVGSLPLLTAKLVTAGMLALASFAALAMAGVAYVAFSLQRQPGTVVWRDVWTAALVVTLSALAGVLLGAAAGSVGRSLTFAAAVVAGFFPVDNILGYMLPILHNATQEKVWGDLTTYLLGLNLNHLPSVLMGRRAAEMVGPEPAVDAMHSLVVIAAYLAVFVVAAFAAQWRRDTLE
jgi:hypothetical protein